MPVFKANFFHAPEFGSIDYKENQLIEVNQEGYIQAILDPNSDKIAYDTLLEKAQQEERLISFPDHTVLLPGFVDLHVHAPQWPQAGIALDEPLDVWLNQCTFPLETKYNDLAFADKVYRDLVSTFLANGTTTALYFATIHKEASYRLAEICAQLGQRGLVGKVVMDHPDSCPEDYRDRDAQTAIKETEEFILDVQALNTRTHQGVYPVITPRFIPSCTDQALAGLGQLANTYQVHVQSHCSEGQWEHDTVYERYGKSDAQALKEFGLLGEKSVMAHCPFLGEEDMELFKETGTAIAHCPISNAYFANGVMPTRYFQEKGIDIGLGTDISGGFSPSLYDNLRQAVMSSRLLEEGVDVRKDQVSRGRENSRIGMNEAFYLATRGGGRSLDLPIGTFEVGMACDFQVIDDQIATHPLPEFAIFTQAEQRLHRILYLANSENIRQVYVQGQLVHQK